MASVSAEKSIDLATGSVRKSAGTASSLARLDTPAMTATQLMGMDALPYARLKWDIAARTVAVPLPQPASMSAFLSI